MKKNSRKIIGIACVIIAIGCIGYIIYYNVKKASNEDIYKKVQKQVEKDKKEQPPKDTGKYVSPINFDELQKINQDIYAYIEIPGTSIHYPIVQSPTDDAYYLDHTIEGAEGYPGSIYTEKANKKDFTDFNTVIYGHDMKDGSMFKDLHKYEDPEYLSQNSQVIIYTPDKQRTYQIFAAVVYDDTHIMQSFNFEDTAQRQSFLDSIVSSRSMTGGVKEDVAVTPDSKILTLSTCLGGQPNNRFLVEAVLVNEN